MVPRAFLLKRPNLIRNTFGKGGTFSEHACGFAPAKTKPTQGYWQPVDSFTFLFLTSYRLSDVETQQVKNLIVSKKHSRLPKHDYSFLKIWLDELRDSALQTHIYILLFFRKLKMDNIDDSSVKEIKVNGVKGERFRNSKIHIHLTLTHFHDNLLSAFYYCSVLELLD